MFLRGARRLTAIPISGETPAIALGPECCCAFDEEKMKKEIDREIINLSGGLLDRYYPPMPEYDPYAIPLVTRKVIPRAK
jgi:hypothetical protein